MKTPLQQTSAWQKLLQDFGHTTFFAEQPDYTFLADLKYTPVGNYLYVPYGPCATTKSGFKKAYSHLIKLAQQHNAVFVRVEPQSSVSSSLLKELGAKKSHDLNPADTWVLDLLGNNEEFLERLPHRLIRYHRTAANRGISITISRNPHDIHHLVKLQTQLAQTKNIGTFSEKYLATELKQDFASLYLVRQNNDVIAAGLVFDDDDTRYNLQGAQSPEGARLHATGILTIQLILDARAKGLKYFDFWGIAPDNSPTNHPWAGFTKFKKSFDGKAIHYCGTWDIPCGTVRYRFYKTLRTANRLKRKILK